MYAEWFPLRYYHNFLTDHKILLNFIFYTNFYEWIIYSDQITYIKLLARIVKGFIEALKDNIWQLAQGYQEIYFQKRKVNGESVYIFWPVGRQSFLGFGVRRLGFPSYNEIVILKSLCLH